MLPAEAGLVKCKAVEDAMKAVDRGLFVPGSQLLSAFNDTPLPIGHAATISAPHMHAACLELLARHLRPGAKVRSAAST